MNAQIRIQTGPIEYMILELLNGIPLSTPEDNALEFAKRALKNEIASRSPQESQIKILEAWIIAKQAQIKQEKPEESEESVLKSGDQ